MSLGPFWRCQRCGWDYPTVKMGCDDPSAPGASAHFVCGGRCVEMPADTRRPSPTEASLDGEPIHAWFELTYAEYLTIPRSVLQSMPVEWQRRFVQCLEQLDEAFDWRPADDKVYRCTLHKPNEEHSEHSPTRYWGRALDDPLGDYERGRRRIPRKA